MEWIDLKHEQPPKQNKNYIIARANGTRAISFYGYGKKFTAQMTGAEYKDVTHWMELPELPENHISNR